MILSSWRLKNVKKRYVFLIALSSIVSGYFLIGGLMSKKKKKDGYQPNHITWKSLDNETKEDLLLQVRDIYESWRANNDDKPIEKGKKQKIISVVIYQNGNKLHRQSVSQFFLREMDKIEGEYRKKAHKEKKQKPQQI